MAMFAEYEMTETDVTYGKNPNFPYAFMPLGESFVELDRAWGEGLDWCVERHGRGSYQWTVHEHDLFVMFRNPNYALEFKLRFC